MKIKSHLLAGLIALSCSAQINIVHAQGSISIGAKAGYTLTSFTGNSSGTITSNGMGLGGVFVNIHMLGFFAIQPELLVHQKGAVHTENNIRDEIKINYFEVPVLFKLLIPIDAHVYPHLFAGPSFSYALNSSFTSTDTQSGNQLSGNVGGISKTDIGGVVGAGLDYETDHMFLTLDGRYGASFNPLGNAANLSLKNNNWTIMAGIGLRFGSSK
jgi:outer membrane scaffolding protein for murein synthesis (MipA/OmpV family)